MRKPLVLCCLFLLFWQVGIAQTDKIPVGYIHTPVGELWIELDERTPNHKKSFIQLAEAGYWDSLTLNRVIPNFVAQGGCPDTPAGFTDPEYLLAPEFHPELKHVYGSLGAGRDDNPGKLSARCQFYIVQNPAGIPRLDGDYTIFGRIIKGMDIIDRIVSVPRDKQDQPLSPISLRVEIKYLSKSEIAALLTAATDE
jgi:peptidyl-prolyl cis-trans isomerase B (cyclophilin B)